MDMRLTPILLVLALSTAGCATNGSNGDQGLDPATTQGHAEPGGPVFENETLEGEVTVTTSYVAAYVVLDGFDYFDVASGTRGVTMDLSWSGSLSEIEMCVREDDYYAEQDCATTEAGEATLTISDPVAGRNQVRFFAATGAASGSYVIEVQHEIWPKGPSGNAEADETALPEATEAT